MIEIWKEIKGYEGLYEISNLGRVKSLTFRKCVHGIDTLSYHDTIMHPTDNGNGYLIVSLRKDKQRKNKYIHRLVAEAFIPNPEHKKVVNHLDHNKTNNQVTNLEWCSQRDNVNYSRKEMVKAHQCIKPNSKTGERYIHYRNRRGGIYEVVINGKYKGSFHTLEDAIKRRNELLNEKEIQYING